MKAEKYSGRKKHGRKERINMIDRYRQLRKI